MERITILKLYENDYYKTMEEGQKIKICGWIKNNRKYKDRGFLEINDGTIFNSVQVVYEKELISNFNNITSQFIGASLEIEGILVKTPNAKQPFEILAENIKVEGESSEKYPLQKKGHSMEYLRTIPHLRVRTNFFNAVFRIRSEMAYSIHKYFNEKGYVYINTPMFTASDCEGAGEIFRVTTLDMNNLPKDSQGKIDNSKDFFGRKVNLAVSGQLEAEAMAMAFGNVYTFGPNFRAENSNTTRHAAEFWMLEAEMAFYNMDQMMVVAEDLTKYIINHVLKECRIEMEYLDKVTKKNTIEKLEKVVSSMFPRIKYEDAIKILSKVQDKFKNKVYFGCDLASEHERYLSEVYFNSPVFVTNYPRDVKPFYMKLDNNKITVSATDCLFPGIGEIIGASQREESLEILIDRMKELDMNFDDYEDYLDLRRYGTVIHSGFGIGFERLVMYITGVSNIRDSILYPRTPGNI